MPENLVRSDSPDVEVAVLSEAGKRQENQDWMSWSQIPWGECYIVADGMGGYKGGALAARMTVEGLEHHLKAQSPDLSFDRALQEAIRRTNDEVYRRAQSGDPETDRMGSTVAVALIAGDRLQVAHIGDSRVYFLHRGQLRLLTTDHTSVQRMVDSGMITETQARHHPEAHILSRAVGSKPEVEIEIGKPVPLEKGDGILLCSDGLSAYLKDNQIEKVLSGSSDVQRIPKRLVDLALNSGSDDNITVQFVRYGEGARAGKKRRRQTARLGLFRRPDRPRGARGFLLWAFLVAAVISLGYYAKNWISSPHAHQGPANVKASGTVEPAAVAPVWILASPSQQPLADKVALYIPGSKPLQPPPGDSLVDQPKQLQSCFIFYPDDSLLAQAKSLAAKLNSKKYCPGEWGFGLYRERIQLRDYVQPKAGTKHLLLAFPSNEGKGAHHEAR